MRTKYLLLIASLFYISCSQMTGKKSTLKFDPPATKIIPVTDTYFGMKVTDNYRWLENLKDSSVLKWFKAQADYTNSRLNKIPGRDSLAADFKRLDGLKPARIEDIQRRGDRYFFKKIFPGERTARLYYRDGKNGKDILLYDPGADDKGVPYSINGFTPSEDGQKVSLGITSGGAEVTHIYTIAVATKKLYPGVIFPSRGAAIGWSPDNKGFLYLLLGTADNHSMDLEMNIRTMYHVVGTDTSQDKEIFSLRKYPGLGIRPRDWCVASYTRDFKYIIASLYTVSNDRTCFYAPASDLLKPVIPWKPLLTEKDHVTNFVLDGDDVYMQTYQGAPDYKIIKSNLGHFSVADAKVVIPEGKEHISNLDRSKDYLFLTYGDGINSAVKQYNLHTGKLDSVALPVTGAGVLRAYGIHSNDGLITLASWKQPPVVFDYDGNSHKITVSSFNIKAGYPGTNDLTVVETTVPGYDGTMIPLSIIYNKNVKLNGTANCLLRGYGAYGISLTPAFNPMMLALANKGIILAVAHVRGGGEKGEAWYKAGYKATKPNTWKDFIACAEYLIKNKYTSNSKLIGMGTSAGGITIGRAITTRPDLFGAAIDNVGCSNALRMENTPNGPANVPEFGTVKDSAGSRALYAMDALHHVKDGTKYPAVICVCGMHDPRVAAWQPAKFAAALQHATTSGRPVLLDVNYGDGHFTEDKSVTFKNFANMFAFALWQTGNPGFQIKR